MRNLIKHAVEEENRILNQIKRKKVNENLELKEQNNNRNEIDVSKILVIFRSFYYNIIFNYKSILFLKKKKNSYQINFFPTYI